MARLEAIWRILTLHCDESSRLASESLDRPLAGPDRLALRLHGLVCASCRRYRVQIHDLRRIAGRMADPSESPGAARLPDDARERIRRALKGD